MSQRSRASRAPCPRTGSAASRPRSACSCCSSSRPAPPAEPATTSRSRAPSRRRRSTSSRRTRRRSAARTRRSSSPSTRARSPTPAPRAAIEGALAEVRELDGVELAASPFEPGGQLSEDGRLAAVDVRYSTDPGDIKKEDGEALIAAGETAEPAVQVEARGMLLDLAAEQEAPVGELVGVADRDRAAHAAVPLRRRDGRDADRRARSASRRARSCWPSCRRRSGCRPSRRSSR